MSEVYDEKGERRISKAFPVDPRICTWIGRVG